MIEPQSMQLGASAWVWNDTLVAPRFRVMVEGPPPPFPLLDLPFPFAAMPLAWPLVASTASSAVGFGAAMGSVATAAIAFGALVSVVFVSVVFATEGASTGEDAVGIDELETDHEHHGQNRSD